MHEIQRKKEEEGACTRQREREYMRYRTEKESGRGSMHETERERMHEIPYRERKWKREHARDRQRENT